MAIQKIILLNNLEITQIGVTFAFNKRTFKKHPKLL